MSVEHLAWLDLETTGTDEHDDCIIEIGVVLTDAECNEVSTFTTPVWLDDAATWRAKAAPEVQRMHDANGLWADLEYGSPIEVVDDLAATWLISAAGSKAHVGLAGSGVAHFDRRFLAVQMPKLARRFTYWALDVGVVRRAFTFAGRDDLIPSTGDGTTKTHRALDDARQHLAEFRCYRDLFGKLA